MSEKIITEPEPTPEDYGKRFREALESLAEARRVFLSQSLAGKTVLTDSMEIAAAIDEFESEQAEKVVAKYRGGSLPWVSNPDQAIDTGWYSDPQADTFFNPKMQTVERIENTATEGTEQNEVWLTYQLIDGRVELVVRTETEDVENTLAGYEHPAIQPLELPDGEVINQSRAGDEVDRKWLEGPQLKAVIELLEDMVKILSALYRNPLTRIRKLSDNRWRVENLG